MNYIISELKWDTDYFGINCAKANLIGTLDHQEIIDFKHELRRFDFVTIVNQRNNPSNNLVIGTTSAFLVDVNIQFQMKTATTQAPAYEVQNIQKPNEELINIAERAFSYSRFFNDPFLEEAYAKKIYVNWVRNSFEKEDKYFIVASDSEGITGFILYSINLQQEIVIELIALNPSSQGKGVGTKLLQSLHHAAGEVGITKINVGTQADNIQAVNFYMKKGFNMVSTSTIYHMWPNERGIRNDREIHSLLFT